MIVPPAKRLLRGLADGAAVLISRGDRRDDHRLQPIDGGRDPLGCLPPTRGAPKRIAPAPDRLSVLRERADVVTPQRQRLHTDERDRPITLLALNSGRVGDGGAQSVPSLAFVIAAPAKNRSLSADDGACEAIARPDPDGLRERPTFRPQDPGGCLSCAVRVARLPRAIMPPTEHVASIDHRAPVILAGGDRQDPRERLAVGVRDGGGPSPSHFRAISELPLIVISPAEPLAVSVDAAREVASRRDVGEARRGCAWSLCERYRRAQEERTGDDEE